MLRHQSAAFGERQREPVLPHLALLVHGIEAGVRPRWQFRLKPRPPHVIFAGGVALHLRLPCRAVAGLAFHDQTLTELFHGGHVFAHFRETDEGIGGLNRLPERPGQQPLMHVVDLERRRIHRHHAEVGLVAGHEPGLQPQGSPWAGRIERRAEEPHALGPCLCRECRQPRPIKPVEEMAHVPALRRRRRNLGAGLLASMMARIASGGRRCGTARRIGSGNFSRGGARSLGGGRLHRCTSPAGRNGFENTGPVNSNGGWTTWSQCTPPPSCGNRCVFGLESIP